MSSFRTKELSANMHFGYGWNGAEYGLLKMRTSNSRKWITIAKLREVGFKGSEKSYKSKNRFSYEGKICDFFI